MSFTRSRRLPRSIGAISVGRGVSFLGDEVALLAMAFRAKDELGHFGVAAIFIAGALPMIALAPFAGLLVDRVRTRPVLVTVTLTQAALCVALAFSSSALLIPLIALLACGTAIAGPAWQALVPTLVAESQLASAMGLLQSVAALAGIAGPFVGGFLVATSGFHVPLLIDAGSFAVLAAIPLLLRVDRVPAGASTGRVSMSEALAGVRLIAASPLLRALLMLVTFFVLTLCAINVVEIFFATEALHQGPMGYGLLGVSFGAGLLATAALSGRIAARFACPERLLVVGCVGLCVGIGAYGLTTQLWQACVLLVFTGAANALLNVNATVLMTTHSADEVRGRVFSVLQGTVSAAQIAAMAVGGLLVVAFAPRTIILASAAAAAVALALTVRPVLRASATPPAPSRDEVDHAAGGLGADRVAA